MSSLEYTYWKAFNRLEPLTVHESIEYLGAQLESRLVNIHRDVDRHPQQFPMKDFLLYHPVDPPSDAEVEQSVFTLFPPPDDTTRQ